MDVTSWITGLMRYNSDALGFIPDTTVKSRYVAKQQYILQCNERGNPVGYLLHGKIAYGQPCVISQHCIELDKRMRGYGIAAVQELVSRCAMRGASSIKLRVATDLPALNFWQSCGFTVTQVVPGGERRQRLIAEMVMPLDLPLLGRS